MKLIINLFLIAAASMPLAQANSGGLRRVLATSGASAPTCPAPDQMVACSAIYDPTPVICDNTCIYDNSCDAKSAGFDVDKDCRPLEIQPTPPIFCPEPDHMGACTDIFDPFPVICGGHCEYEDSCEASLAGFDVDTECVKETEEVCPQPFFDGPSMCPSIYDPYLCENCEYANGCLAEHSGFELDEDCVKVNEVPTESDPKK